MDSKIIKILLLVLFSTTASAVEFKGKFIQGHFILGKTQSGAKILIDKKKIKVSNDGYFVFGIGKDRKIDITITEKIEGNTRKGEMVLLHSHTIHGSETNHSDRFRRNFLAGYALQGTKFTSGKHMKRERIDIYELQKKYW